MIPSRTSGPPSLQRQSVGQNRTLTNAGLRTDISYVKGANNIKAGATYEQTFLRENDTLGIVDPAFNAPCITASPVTPLNPFPYVPVPGFTDTSQCTGANQPNTAANPHAPGTAFYPYFNPLLLPYDLTRQRRFSETFNGRTDVKELALYVRDAITVGNWVFEPRYTRRSLQRDHHCAASRTSSRDRIQRQENQYDPPRFLRPHVGISL